MLGLSHFNKGGGDLVLVVGEEGLEDDIGAELFAADRRQARAGGVFGLATGAAVAQREDADADGGCS